jgi:hypothetical protein
MPPFKTLQITVAIILHKLDKPFFIKFYIIVGELDYILLNQKLLHNEVYILPRTMIYNVNNVRELPLAR